MYYLYHRLGIQSNLIVSARYATADDVQLSRPLVVGALRAVVEAHPALRLVAVQRPSPNRGRHRLYVAALHSINLDACVEFVEDDASSELFQRLHNEWQFADDEPTRPYWKVLVTPKQEVVFVYHHLIADGASGLPFHRTFHRALNSAVSTMDTPVSVNVLKADPASIEFLPDPLSLLHHKPSILEIVWFEFLFFFAKLIYGKKFLFGTLPPAKPYFTSVTGTASPEQRTITRVSSLRIPASKMTKILAACRENKTTFTPLLIVVLTVTLVREWFPEAKVGCPRYAYDFRPFARLPKPEGVQGSDGIMFNGASGCTPLLRLDKFRRAVLDSNDEGKTLDDSTLDADAIWRLARDYKANMQKDMAGVGLRALQGGRLLGADLEDFVKQALPSIGRLISASFLVSNLGSFSVSKDVEDKKPRWGINDVQFSVAATNGRQGCHGPVFNVVGAKGGDTIINSSSEEGVFSRDIAHEVLVSTMAKLEELV